MYAEERLKAEIIQETMQKKVVTVPQRRELAQAAVAIRGISIRLACNVFRISESGYRYQPVLCDENQ